jgi:hypothetical protein
MKSQPIAPTAAARWWRESEMSDLAAFIIAMGLIAGLGWIGDSYRYGIDKQCEQHQGGEQDG